MDGDDSQPRASGGRSLGGGAAEPLPASWANRATQPRVGRVGQASSSGAVPNSSDRRIATMSDLTSSAPGPSGGHAGHGHPQPQDDDDSSEDDKDDPPTYFAGGERSALSVENPGRQRRGNNIVRDILRKASEASSRAPPPAAAEARGGAFSGSGNTLGSDEIPSSFIPDPNAPPPRTDSDQSEEEEPPAVRLITFWRNGFNIEDGPLQSYEAPENVQLLNDIYNGHAPPSVLNVRVGQSVEVRIARRQDEDYAPQPPRPLGTFEGQGHRLGAPVPSVGSNSLPSNSASRPVAGALRSPTDAGSVQTQFEVNMSEPTTSIQLRLADGSRMVARMNLTHTVGDIRQYINASNPGMSSRAYLIQTTFPTRVLDDDSQTVVQAGLVNSVVVQRWL